MTTESGASGAGASDLDLFEEEATGQPNSNVVKDSPIPAKYAGKTVEELINMNVHAEKLIGRQGSELGQMRRMADEILQLKKPAPTTQQTERAQPVTVDALLNDPQKAINALVEQSPLAQRAINAEQRVIQLESRLTESEFAGKGRDIQKDINDPAFLEWVNKNPLRQSLALEAAKEGSQTRHVAAKNLWDMWDEYKELTGQRDASGANRSEGAARRTSSTATSTVRQAPTDFTQNKKPNWSRAKLMELRYKVADGDPAAVARWNDPTFQARMNEAYAEERVK
jgi:hypothetical protein